MAPPFLSMGKITISQPNPQSVDPVGAGDAYRGGLLWGLDHGYSPIQSARFGALIAAQKVAVAGPNYTYSEEELLKDYEAFFKDEDL